jgi:hypothetical protein
VSVTKLPTLDLKKELEVAPVKPKVIYRKKKNQMDVQSNNSDLSALSKASKNSKNSKNADNQTI